MGSVRVFCWMRSGVSESATLCNFSFPILSITWRELGWLHQSVPSVKDNAFPIRDAVRHKLNWVHLKADGNIKRAGKIWTQCNESHVT